MGIKGELTQLRAHYLSHPKESPLNAFGSGIFSTPIPPKPFVNTNIRKLKCQTPKIRKLIGCLPGNRKTLFLHEEITAKTTREVGRN